MRTPYLQWNNLQESSIKFSFLTHFHYRNKVSLKDTYIDALNRNLEANLEIKKTPGKQQRNFKIALVFLNRKGTWSVLLGVHSKDCFICEYKTTAVYSSSKKHCTLWYATNNEACKVVEAHFNDVRYFFDGTRRLNQIQFSTRPTQIPSCTRWCW